MAILKVINPKIKAKIDAMSYEEMLRLNRFAPVGEPLFQGVTGIYFFETMSSKRIEIGNAKHIKVSKKIGWEAI